VALGLVNHRGLGQLPLTGKVPLNHLHCRHNLLIRQAPVCGGASC
jgi:hypothetical protein